MKNSNNQFFFSFGNKSNYLEEDFIVSSSNQDCHKFIKSWPSWGKQRLANVTYLEGAVGSGKTHLATIWQQASYARFLFKNDFLKDDLLELIESRQCFIIDNLESFVGLEKNILHIINLIIEEKKFLLITSSNHPSKNQIKLPDLSSRIMGCNHLKINEPDSVLLEGVILKLLSDRQLRVTKEVLNFILTKIERSYESINHFVSYIDKKSLEQKRSITIPFLSDIAKN